MKTKLWIIMAGFISMGFIFIGVRFLLWPEFAEDISGLQINESGDYALHRMSGIRDLSIGFLILAMVISGQKKPLGISLLIIGLIPLGDLAIVLSKNYSQFNTVIPQILVLILCAITGFKLIRIAGKQTEGKPY